MALRVLAVAIFLLWAVLGAAGVAHAQDKPWAAGVSKADQDAALALYQDGNGYFEQSLFKQAYEKYELALTSWDHPAIRYNAAVCLINLDRPVEAYEHLLAALRFGEPPLGKELFAQAQTYEKMLKPRIAELEIVCKEPGAEITLDGEPLFVAPGTTTKRVLVSDPHQIVAKKDKYETVTQSVTLQPGARTTLVLKLKLLESAKKLTRRWAPWKPWAVVAGGVVVGGVGLALYLGARSDLNTYDDEINLQCPMGCNPEPPALVKMREGAERNETIAYSAWAISGAVIATGAILVYLNQPKLAATVTPTIGREHAGAVLTVRW